MPVYKWEGKTRSGGVKRGTMEAPNEQAVTLRLKQQQIVPDKIQEAKSFMNKLNEFEIPGLEAKIKKKSLVIFTRQFATMIDAGLPLVQGIDILASQNDDRVMQKILFQVKTDVETGSTLSGAMAKHVQVFDTLYTSLVAAGELGGILDTILDRLATYIESAQKLTARIKSAMMYPTVVAIVAVAAVVGLMVGVIPIFADMFKELGSELPGPTLLAMNISEFIQTQYLLLLGIIIAIVAAYKIAMKSPTVRYGKDFVLLNMPIFGNLLKKTAVARFSQTLGTMISSGIPILQALDVVEKTAGNLVIEKAIVHVKDAISEGKSMAEPLLNSGVFPPMVVQMIAVGEQTGALDSMLGKIADFYNDEVEVAVDGLTTLIEPLMMVVLGGAVGFILIAMYLPIFKIAGAMEG